MKAGVKQELIGRLESGDYNKGVNNLCYEDTKGVLRYCTLGVVAQIYEDRTSGIHGKWIPVKLVEDDGTNEDAFIVNASWKIRGETTKLDEKIMTWAGMSTREHKEIIDVNDESGTRSFVEVIKYLENNL